MIVVAQMHIQRWEETRRRMLEGDTGGVGGGTGGLASHPSSPRGVGGAMTPVKTWEPPLEHEL